ncbi:MBL fold metallo-hydrolase [Halopseudomonas pachastrellae]|nr:MBL fold metallo-hydrolase [Halopseudomonas pachastrellae]
MLKQKTGCQIASAAVINAEHVDLPLQHGQRFGVKGVELEARATPGHTDGCMSYVLSDKSMVFTGDALLIRGCGAAIFSRATRIRSTTRWSSSCSACRQLRGVSGPRLQRPHRQQHR